MNEEAIPTKKKDQKLSVGYRWSDADGRETRQRTEVEKEDWGWN